MGIASSDGIEIVYDDDGEGEPAIVLLPDWCEPRTGFDAVAPILARTHRVIRLDWRGHGESGAAPDDFNADSLVEDAIVVLRRVGVHAVAVVSVGQAGWIALELRRRLGRAVEKIVALNWFVLEPPEAYLDILAGLQDASHWEAARERLFAMWQGGDGSDVVRTHIHEAMAAQPFDMWCRAAREAAVAYARYTSPFRALAKLEPRVPFLHVYAQPATDAYAEAQESYASALAWFQIHRVEGRTSFPALEAPQAVADAINDFVG